jgi:hypothetical protein
LFHFRRRRRGLRCIGWFIVPSWPRSTARRRPSPSPATVIIPRTAKLGKHPFRDGARAGNRNARKTLCSRRRRWFRRYPRGWKPRVFRSRVFRSRGLGSGVSDPGVGDSEWMTDDRRETLIEQSNVQVFGNAGGVFAAGSQQKERARRSRMRDRSKLIEADDANERGAEFKRAGKLGQENEQAMQVKIPPPSAIFLPSIFLPAHSCRTTQHFPIAFQHRCPPCRPSPETCVRFR